MKTLPHPPRAASLLLAPVLALAACSGGGGGSSLVTPDPELRPTTLAVDSPVPTKAHELQLTIGIASATKLENVGVSFYLLHKGDVDGDVEEPRQFLIDTITIDQVEVGEKTYETLLTVPTDIEPTGVYYLVPRVDPLNAVAETDEDNNMPPASDLGVEITIDDGNTNNPDFTLDDLRLDRNSAVLFPQERTGRVGRFADEDNHHISATALVQTLGAPVQKGVAFAVAIEVPGANGGSTEEALLLWDESRLRYTEFLLSTIERTDPQSIALDVTVPEQLRLRLLKLIEAGRTEYNLVFRVNPGERIPEWEMGTQRYLKQREDDAIVLPITLLAPAAAGDCVLWSSNFERGFRNRYLGMQVGFESDSRLNGDGGHARAAAFLPVQIFDADVEFFQFEATARVDPRNSANTRFRVAAEILDIVVWERISEDPTYEYKETPFKKEETVERKSIVFAGPVPIEVEAGATGTLGFELTARLTSASLELSAMPYCDLSASASASVSAVVARGGIAGDMTLVRDEFTLGAGIGGIRVVDNNRAITGSLFMAVTNELTGPKGRLYLFAEYPGVKFCKTLVGRVPCGVKEHRKEKTLVKFRTFRKVDVLFKKQQSFKVSVNCQ